MEESLSTPVGNRGMKGMHFDTVEKRNEENNLITFESAKKCGVGGLNGFNGGSVACEST